MKSLKYDRLAVPLAMAKTKIEINGNAQKFYITDEPHRSTSSIRRKNKKNSS